MKIFALALLLSTMPVAGDAPPAEVAAAPPDCEESWRAARLICAKDAEGIAVGNYGGTEFFLSCNGETRTTFCTVGSDFRYIMEGFAPGGPVVRCALSGTAHPVNEKCGPLHLIIN